jgi:hypothetical protein
MPLDTTIPLRGDNTITTSPGGMNALQQEQLQGQRMENFNSRDKQRIQSTVIGAARLKTYLDANDTEGARGFLNDRRQQLQSRIGSGENIDTNETDDALRLLDKDPEQLKKLTGELVNFGQMSGILQTPKQNEGFTLSQGQTRYDASGKAVASVAPKAGTTEVVDPVTGAVTYSNPKPMPAAALKLQNDSLDIIGTASSIESDLGTLVKKLDEGKIKLGPIDNLVNAGRNYTGNSTEESRNYGTFKSTLEKMRNDSLRLNKGVQTEGDAVRAWNEIFQNINDEKLVITRLKEIQNINKRAGELQQLNVDNIRANYGQPSIDYNKYKKGSALESEENIQTGGNIGTNTTQPAQGGIKFLGFE